MTARTLYEVLGVTARADSAQVEAAYTARRQALQGNPDELSLLVVAYDTLRHPVRRAAYDRELARRATAAAENPGARGGAPARRGPRTAVWAVALLLALPAIVFWRGGTAPAPSAVADRPAPRQPLAPPPPDETPAAAPGDTAGGEPAVPLPEPPAGAKAEARPLAEAPAGTTVAVVQAARGVKQPGFDLRYLAWSVFLIGQQRGSGSGVLIGPDRILTNCHVLAGGATNRLFAIHSVTRTAYKVEKYARLVEEDACLLFAPGAGNDSVAWGDSAALRPGDTVHTLGHPGGSRDIMWSQGRFLDRVSLKGESFLFSTNECRPGSSGGPLLDNDGRLVGIVTLTRYFQSKTGGPPQYRDCISLTEATARALLGQPLFPIALAPAQYFPNY